LGIDAIPLKTCNWNCVYCQLGRTKPVINKRERYFPPKEIVNQVKRALHSHEPAEIDWVTFVGAGEPTLNVDIGWMIREVQSSTDHPVAVITNGSLLYLPIVREELSAAEAVLPSIDAGTEEIYRKVNRPHPEIKFQTYLEGLISFSQEYKGKLWPEVMLVQGLNDTEHALIELAGVIQHINPDVVHINTPTRPPAEAWVQPPDAEGLMRAAALLGNAAHVVQPVEGTIDLSGQSNLFDAAIGIITRHPMCEEDLKRALAEWVPGDLTQFLMELERDERSQVVIRYGIRFWCAAPSFFPK
jgi:wyosine [tRNA(Phe)-imidazoG37] synthetase (radical SAM superfamily)